jgi:hypothetical protein
METKRFSEEIESNFTGSRGAECHERADLKAKLSIKKGRGSQYNYQWQILEPIEKKKTNRSFTVSVITLNRTERKATLKGPAS